MSDESKVQSAPTKIPIRTATDREQLTTNFGSYRLTWTNGVVNICFLCIYVLLQISAVDLLVQLDYKSFVLGIEIFLLACVMEFCLVIQLPQLMKWIPFWTNSFGRGVALLLVSVMAMNGIFMVGFICIFLSIAVMCACVFSGNFDIAPPVLDYNKVFGNHRGINNRGGLPLDVHSYDSIPTLGDR